MFFIKYGEIRIMSAHAGGMCIDRCKHRPIPVFAPPNEAQMQANLSISAEPGFNLVQFVLL